MSRIILDTDTLSYFLKGNENIVRNFASYPDTAIHTTIINYAELLFGACASIKKNLLLAQIERLLSEMTIIPFCQKSAHIFAAYKAKLRQNGTPIADMDLMIASITLANKATLITNNTRHFNRIENLKLENWL